ncbi:Protein of unknown function [Gryllus bimaculatus]|nr:Protein of unknown function [Gryllus bimaculatus]
MAAAGRGVLPRGAGLLRQSVQKHRSCRWARERTTRSHNAEAAVALVEMFALPRERTERLRVGRSPLPGAGASLAIPLLSWIALETAALVLEATLVLTAVIFAETVSEANRRTFADVHSPRVLCGSLEHILCPDGAVVWRVLYIATLGHQDKHIPVTMIYGYLVQQLWVRIQSQLLPPYLLQEAASLQTRYLGGDLDLQTASRHPSEDQNDCFWLVSVPVLVLVIIVPGVEKEAPVKRITRVALKEPPPERSSETVAPLKNTGTAHERSLSRGRRNRHASVRAVERAITLTAGLLGVPSARTVNKMAPSGWRVIPLRPAAPRYAPLHAASQQPSAPLRSAARRGAAWRVESVAWHARSPRGPPHALLAPIRPAAAPPPPPHPREATHRCRRVLRQIIPMFSSTDPPSEWREYASNAN